MTMQVTFTPDDFFVLENACSVAIALGDGDKVREIMRFIQAERPTSARGFVMEALHLHAKGEHETALAVLKENNAMSSEEGGDEALGVCVALLSALDREGDAVSMGRSLMASETPMSDAVRYTIGSIIEQSEKKAARAH